MVYKHGLHYNITNHQSKYKLNRKQIFYSEAIGNTDEHHLNDNIISDHIKRLPLCNKFECARGFLLSAISLSLSAAKKLQFDDIHIKVSLVLLLARMYCFSALTRTRRDLALG
jgi:hypothetical protein